MKLLLVLLLCTLNSFYFAASDSSFFNCLSKNGIQTDEASKLVYTPKSSSYTTVLESYIRNRRFNTTTTPKPVIIVTPLQESQVAATVLCAKYLKMQLKIRSGGHDYEGISYVSDSAFTMLDMFNLKSINVNMEDQTAWVQSGATLGELFYSIWEKSRVHGFPSGICPTVGVGGHFSGGGYGPMLRRYGLAVDHIIDAKIVDVNGRVLDRKEMGEDLFWAIKGGGGASFGVVLAYRINLVSVPETTTVFRVERFMEQDATDIVYRWQQVADNIDNDLFIKVLLQPITVKGQSKKSIRATFMAMFLGNANRLMSVMDSKFPELGLKKTDCQEMSWIQSVLYWEIRSRTNTDNRNFDNQTSPEALLSRTSSVNFLKRKSDYVQTPISKDGLNWTFKKMIELGKTGLVFTPYGGKMSEIPESDTPFPHRAGNIYKIQYSVNWNEEGAEADKTYITEIRRLFSYMTPFVSKNPRSAFLNYRDLDIGATDNGDNSYDKGKVYGVKYFKNNFDRLVKIKTAVDPDNFFRNEQSIPTLPGGKQ